jgi:hypothetical protein
MDLAIRWFPLEDDDHCKQHGPSALQQCPGTLTLEPQSVPIANLLPFGQRLGCAFVDCFMGCTCVLFRGHALRLLVCFDELCPVVQGFMPLMGLVHCVALALVATISRVAFVDAADSPPVVWTWVGGQSGTTGSVSLGTPYVYSSSNRPGKMEATRVLNGANSSLWLVTFSDAGALGVWAMEPRTCHLASYWYCNGCTIAAGIRGQESPSNSPGLSVFAAPGSDPFVVCFWVEVDALHAVQPSPL